MSETCTLFYVHDPMCSWCWGYQRTWEQLRAALPDSVTVVNVVGGLASDSDEPMPPEQQETIAGYWAKVAEQTGAEFNFDYSFDYVVSLVYLAVFASIVAFGSYLKLLGRIGAHKAGYVVVMFPVVALVLSIMFEDLRFELNILLGVTLVLAGNLVILGFSQVVTATKSLWMRAYMRPFGLRLAYRANAVRYMSSLLSGPGKDGC